MTSTCHFNCVVYVHFVTILKSECTGKANTYPFFMQHENDVVMGRMMLAMNNLVKKYLLCVSHEMSAECSTSGWFALLLSLDF